MTRWNAFGWTLSVLVCGTLAIGCTAIRRDSTLQTERTLAASGFQMKFAQTPEQLQSVQKLEQRTLIPTRFHGETRFVYADAEFCKCMYVGTPKAYQEYQKLSINQQISQSQLMAAESYENASMSWGMWGGWGPWY